MSEQTPEPNVQGAYCAEGDLRLGDIRLPNYITREQGIKTAADEIDEALGHIYITPIEIPNDAQYRPARLALKKINWLLASGRMILDLNASGESDNQHAYGMGMLKEGLALLKAYATEERKLDGAAKIELPEGEQPSFTGPAIFNEDPESLVESFYKRSASSPMIDGLPPRQAMPYGLNRSVI